MELGAVFAARNNLEQMKNCMKEKIDFYMDEKNQMQQQLDSLKDSFNEVVNYIKIEEKNEANNKEDNIFFLNSSYEKEDTDRLKNLLVKKEKLTEQIASLEHQMDSYDKMNAFLFELRDSIADTLNKVNIIDKTIKDFHSEKEELKKNMLEKLILCQHFASVDQNRCKIELSELVHMCEESN